MSHTHDVSRRTFLTTSGLVGGALSTGFGGLYPLRANQRAFGSEEQAVEVTRTLADYVVRAEPGDLPDAPRRECVRSFLNWFGCAVGGARHATVDRALAGLTEFSGTPTATVIARAEKLDVLHAALMNGISSHVLDYDDTHLETIIHPAGPVAPALLAVAERQRVTGADLIHALTLGIETECRIGKAVYPSHYDVGWHITGTAGVFGSAAATGKLLGLNTQQMTWALGIAATQSSGLREMFGTMCKSFHPGRAAQDGMTAAFLASKNFTSSERGIEAPRGFAHVMATERDFSQITDGLGRSFEVTKNAYKPFACGIVIHPTIDACLQLRDEHDLTADAIERIDLDVHPLVLELTGNKTPTTGLEGKFSVYHSAAVAIIHGAAGPRQYSDQVVQDPAVIALRDRVRAQVVTSVREDGVLAAITLRNGETLRKHIDHAVGSVENPMSDDALEAKFRDLADGVLPAAQTDELIDMCWSVASLDDVGAIARASASV